MRSQVRVIFFDLGDTLVGASRSWQPGARGALATLAEGGSRLGLISNTTGLTDRAAILALLPADFSLTAFEAGLVIFSSEVVIDKPQTGNFEKALAAAGLPAAECLYCSENPVETLAAQAAGMRVAADCHRVR